MKKIEIEKVKEYLYYEKLDNGLRIYMVPKSTIDDFYVSFTTNFGGSNTEFIPIDESKMKKFPDGIAHFLEHKMFEQENGIDPMIFFSETGTSCNAVTDYYNTSYLFYGDNDIEKNLEYLLNFVQSPYFTDENVEKEKGIIEQEINMYNDSPDRVIYEKLLFNLFKVNPIRYSVSGTTKDISQITKELLYSCYNTFYNPKNMFLTITGNFDVEKVLELIKNNQSKKQFKEAKDVEIKEYDEPLEVYKEYEEKSMNLEIPYIAFGIKIPNKDIKLPEVIKDLYFLIVFQYLFSITSDFYEENIKNELLDSPISVEMIHTKDYKVVILVAKSRKYKELIEKIKDKLNNIDITSEYLERKKKVYISSLIYSTQNTEEINSNITESITIYGKYYADMYSVIKSLNKKDLDKFIKLLNLKNYSIYVIK